MKAILKIEACLLTAAAVALLLPLVASADNVPVVVRNSAANPVPVSGTVNATVSGSVSITNLPANQNVTVTNAVPVSGTVNATITGTPTVNIGTMPPVSVNAVVQDPAKSGFTLSLSTNGSGTFGVLDVPTGQRAVIELVSVECEHVASTGPDPGPGVAGLFQWMSLGAGSTSGTKSLAVPLQLQSSSSTGNYYAGTFSGRYYVDPNPLTTGSALNVTLNGPNAGCGVTIGGYFVTL